MSIQIKRVYDTPSPNDGIRVLVDRVWPRGVSRKDADLTDWARELAPSDELRKWFDHKSERWQEFQVRYLRELNDQPKAVLDLAVKSRRQTVTLLYAAKDTEHNNAIVLCQYMERIVVEECG